MDNEEKRDRQMLELLNELRVALPGVQFLLAFLLTVPFAQGFERITQTQKTLFYAALLATARLDRLPDRAERHPPPALPPARPRRSSSSRPTST